MNFFTYLLNDILALSFWLLIGCAISTLLHFLVPKKIIDKHLSSNNLTSITKAALIGIPLPLCSCSVVPTVIGLKNKGVNKASNMSFLISTPQTGIDSIFITAAFFGWTFAYYKLGIALALGLLGGIMTILVLKNSSSVAESSKASSEQIDKFNFKNAYSYFINESLFMIWKWLLIGLILAALIQTFIPPNFMENIDWANSYLGVLLVLGFSLFTYICATGSVPLAAALVSTGFPTEAAIVLLIAGPATNISTLTIILKHFGKAFTAIYLAVVILGTLAFSYGLSGQFEVLTLGDQCHDHLSRPIHEWVAAIFLIGYTFYFAFNELKQKFKTNKSNDLNSYHFEVSGVTCNGCVNKIRKALNEINPKIDLEINIEDKELTLYLPAECKLSEVTATIESLNFQLKPKEKKSCCGTC